MSNNLSSAEMKRTMRQTLGKENGTSSWTLSRGLDACKRISRPQKKWRKRWMPMITEWATNSISPHEGHKGRVSSAVHQASYQLDKDWSLEYVHIENYLMSIPPICTSFCNLVTFWEMRHIKEYQVPQQTKYFDIYHDRGSNRQRLTQQ